MTEKLIRVLIDETLEVRKKINVDWSLEQARASLLTALITVPFDFIQGKLKIPITDESNVYIKDILINGVDLNLATQYTILLNGTKLNFQDYLPITMSLHELREQMQERGHYDIRFIVQNENFDPEQEEEKSIKECIKLNDGFIYIINEVNQPDSSQTRDLKNIEQTANSEDKNHRNQQSQILGINNNNNTSHKGPQSISSPITSLKQNQEPGKQSSTQNEDEKEEQKDTKTLEISRQSSEYDSCEGEEQNIETTPRSETTKSFERAKIEETAQELYEQANRYPECLERSIQLALSIIMFKSIRSVHFAQDKKFTEDLDEILQREVNKVAELSVSQQVLSLASLQNMQGLNKQLQANNFKEISIKLNQVLKEIMPLDIQKIKILIEKADQAITQVAGKDIIIFQGITGAGKSTTIHLLAGSTIERIMLGDIAHFGPTQINIQEAQSVKSNPFNKSETRYITAVPIEYDGSSYVLCDSPGYEDTCGPVVDIANGIGITKAVQSCNSVRPVFLFSFQSIGDRYQEIKKVAYLVSSMVKNLDDNIETFQYVFTKFNKDQKNGLTQRINEFLKDELVKDDEIFKTFLKDLRDKVQEKRVFFLDPVQTNLDSILSQLTKKRNKISNPKDVFKFYITKTSRSAINEQFNLHCLRIEEAFNRGDFPLVDFKLNELSYIAEVLDSQPHYNIYRDCCVDLSAKINKKYQETSSNITQFFSLENKLVSEHIQQFQEAQKADQLSDELKSRHLSLFSKDTKSNAEYSSLIANQINQLMQQADQMEASDHRLTAVFSKIKLLDQFYPQEIPNFTLLQNAVIAKLNLDVASFLIKAFERSCIEEQIIILSNVAITINNLKKHIAQEKIDSVTKKLNKEFNNGLNAQSEEIKLILRSDLLEDKQMLKIKIYIDFLKSFLQLYSQQKLLNLEHLKSQFQELNDLILALFNNSIQVVNFYIKKQEGDKEGFSNVENMIKNNIKVKQHLEQAQKIQNEFSHLQSDTIEKYFKTINGVITDIQEYASSIARNVSQLLFVQEKQLYIDLINQMKGLAQLEWIDTYKEGLHAQANSSIQKQIEQLHQQLLNSANQIVLSLERPEDLDKMSTIYFHMEQMQNIPGDSQSQNKELQAKILQSFKYQVSRLQKAIEDQCFLSEQSIPEGESSSSQNSKFVALFCFKDFDQSLKYLQKFQSLKFDNSSSPELFEMKQQSATLLQKLKNNIQELNRLAQLRVDELFNGITSFNGDVNNNALNQESKELQLLLLLLKDIYENTDLFRLYFDPQNAIVTQFRNLMTSQAEKLDDDIQLTAIQCKSDHSQIFELRRQLHIARALQNLDDFNDSAIKIRVIYSEYNRKFAEEYPRQNEIFLDNIIKCNFTQIVSIFEKLKSLNNDAINVNQLTKAEQVLKLTINGLIEDTTAMALRTKFRNNVQEQLITNIMQNIEKLKECKLLSEFIPGIDIEKEIQVIINLVNKNYRNHLKKLIDQIDAIQFIDAIKDMDLISQQYLRFDLQLDKESQKQFQLFNEAQLRKLDNLFNEYKSMVVKDFIHYPPKNIIKELENCVNDNNNSSFKTTKLKIEKILVEKFQNEFLLIKNTQVKYDQLQKISSCRSLLKTLPETQQTQLEQELDHVLIYMDEENSRNNYILTKAKDNKDWKTIEERIIQNNTNKNFKEQQEIQEIITKGLNDAIQIKIQYPIDFSNEFIHQLREFSVLLSIYEKHYQNQKQPMFTKIKFQLEDAFTKTINEFNYELSQENNSTDSGEFLDNGSIIMESPRNASSADDLINFFKFRETEEALCLKFIPQFDQLISRNSEIIKNDIDLLKKQFQQSLLTRDFEQLFAIYTKSKGYSKPKEKFFRNGDFKSDVLKKFRAQLMAVQSCNDLKGKIDPLVEEHLVKTRAKAECIAEEIKLDNIREQDYCELNKLMRSLAVMVEKGQFLYNDLTQQQQNIQSLLNDNIKKLYSKVTQLTEDKVENSNFLRQFNISQGNLATLKKTLDPDFINTKIDLEQIYEGMIKLCITIVQKIQNQQQNISNIEEVSNILITVKNVGIEIPCLEEQINGLVNKELAQIKKHKKQKGIKQLASALQNSEIGSIIINQHKVFSSINLDQFQEKTKKHDINYVLDKIKGDENTKIDIGYLREKYDQYDSIYRSIITKATIQQDMIPELINRIVAELHEQQQNQKSLKEWKGTFKSQFAVMIAKISAIWTITVSKEYFDQSAETSESSEESTFVQPHPAQVIAIFSLLGMGDFSDKKLLINTLIEIGTGEGKSLTLAIASSVFALLGLEVNCACYSAYLSERDLSDFANLFQTLKVEKYIHYGNFNKLCERIINLDVGDFRKVIGDIITENNAQMNPIVKQEMKIQVLLIDEVDVFFSKDFYGEVYSPQTSLKDPLINQLLDLIWSKKDESNITLEKIQQTEEYINVLGLYSNWQNLIDESVKDMIADVKTYQDHQYVLDSSKIGYKEQDRVVFSITFGYKTIFAYYAELNKLKALPNATPQQIKELENNMREASCIGLNCGNFSYALIPASFQYIMGVSGTLQDLNKAQVNMIRQNYQIQKRIYMPSVFGKNNLNFNYDADLILCEEQDYYNSITNDIQSKIDNERSVLVFFETKEDLLKFYESKNYAMLKQQTNLLTEEEPVYKKENIIMRATSSKSVTLFTKCFGRGTDFKAFDKVVIDRGGVHVISTFFSEDISEEVQIKGRTARQGQLGTFKIIVLDHSLEKFQISKKNGLFNSFWNFFSKQQEEVKQLTYKLINEHRDMYSQNQYVHNIKKAQDAKEEHEKACQLQSLIYKGNKKGVQEMLLKYNIGATLYSDSRTIVIMDATGSMGSLLEKCQSSVSIMFERGCSILVENGRDEKCFKLQFVAYRNYNAPENKLLEYSPWTSKPEELKTFMNMVKPNYGICNEAAEVGFWHAGQENNKEKISQIILIADMPPNTKEELARHKNNYPIYKNTRFAAVQCYDIELQQFINQKIPVHAFYVGNSAKTVFEDIANKTGGQCAELKIHSNEGTEMLTNLVTQEILRSVGGEQMVKQYQKKYTA